jgi:hypothetical protein
MSLDDKRDLKPDSESVIRGSSGIEDDDEERRLIRKLDRRILPITTLMYLFACPYYGHSMSAFWTNCHHHRLGQKQPGQRSSSGSAKGCPRWRPYWQEVRLGRFRFLLLLCELSHSYSFERLSNIESYSNHRQILCQVPATILAKLNPPRLWLGCAAIGWGICSTLMVRLHLITLRINFDLRNHTCSPPHSTKPGSWLPE